LLAKFAKRYNAAV